MKVTFKHEFNKLARQLDLAQKQYAFAAAASLTNMAKTIRDEMKAEMPQVFDRPTPFTMNSMYIKSATKGYLEAIVDVKDIQAEYLKLEQTGGMRLPRNTSNVVVPINAALNSYGNIKKNYLRGLSKKKDYFVGTVHGTAGVWQRIPGHRLKLIALFKPETYIPPKWDYDKRIMDIINKNSDRVIRQWIAKAIATAR